jgi:hypothetical protein
MESPPPSPRARRTVSETRWLLIVIAHPFPENMSF